jgi:hypothetical protein
VEQGSRLKVSMIALRYLSLPLRAIYDATLRDLMSSGRLILSSFLPTRSCSFFLRFSLRAHTHSPLAVARGITPRSNGGSAQAQ